MSISGFVTNRTLLAGDPTPRRATIDSLTSLRGLVALWVVLYHFRPDLIALLPSTKILSPFLGQGHFAVPIFFVLSGYVLTHNYLDSLGARAGHLEILRFWGRRLVRIYPLHLATLLAVLLMVIAARLLHLTISEAGYSGRDFALNLFLVQTWVPHFRLNWNYPSWSISSEWFAYLLFPLLCVILIKIRSLASLAGVALLAYLLCIGHIMAGDGLPFRELAAVVGPFLFGCTFARAIDSGYTPQSGLRAGAWVLLATLFLLPYIAVDTALSVTMVTIGSALVFALGAADKRCSRFWLWRPLIVLGEVSYSLYLTHTIVQKLVNELAPAATFVGRPLAVRLLVLGGYAVSVALATWIAYVGVDIRYRKPLRHQRSTQASASEQSPPGPPVADSRECRGCSGFRSAKRP